LSLALAEQLADIAHLALADCEGAKHIRMAAAEEELPYRPGYQIAHAMYSLPSDRHRSASAQ